MEQTIFPLLFAVHGLGDFVFQPSWMATGKLESWQPRLAHTAIHWAGTFYACLLIVSISHATALATAIAATHFAIDCRRWRTFDTGNGLIDSLLAIFADQALHIMALALVSILYISTLGG